MNNHGMRQFAWTLVVILSTVIAAEVKGDIVLDHSPSLYGTYTDAWENLSFDQNFAENFLFNTAVQLTGMDIYSHYSSGSVGTSATIRLWSDSAGLPQTLLLDFTEPISFVDSDGASGEANRKHVDFTTPITLSANTTYWIGMSATGEDFYQTTLFNLPPGGDGFTAQFLNTAYIFQAEIGDMAFRLHGDVAVPEPSSVMVCSGLAWAVLAVARRKRS